MTVADNVLTRDDIASLNRAAVERSAWFARAVGAGLIGVGLLGLAGWLWLEVRLQQQLGNSSGFSGGIGSGTSADFLDRVDIFVQSLSLGLIAAAVCGIGVAARGFADYSVARLGGSLTGFAEGDEMDLDPADDDQGEGASD